MKKRFTLFVLLILSIVAEMAYSQICATPGFDGSFDISGQVNTYYPPAPNTILSSGATSVRLDKVPDDVTANIVVNGAFVPFTNSYSKGQIHIGDLLLIIQMQNASIESSNSNLYGAGVPNFGPDGLGGTGYTSLGNTGLFEYVVATSDVPITGGLLTFRGAGVGTGVVNTYLNTDYDPASTTRGQRTFQVVRAPQYSNVRLTGNIAAPPFNGKVGGIIAFDVAGIMDFNNKTIDASARGFRAGFVYTQGTPGLCNNGTYVALSTNIDYQTSGKGEGIVGSPKNAWDGFKQVINPLNEGLPVGSFGRGAPGNGGGGGNAHNSGGGGGGNGGFGGLGGSSCCNFCTNNTTQSSGGRPGSTTGTPTPARLFMGGGGGAGEVNNASMGNSGGVGGGIVLLNVGTIIGTGTITANGGAGQNAGWCSVSPYTITGCVTNDGGGGGGAGGTVYLKVSTPNPGSILTISANGGNGGTCSYNHGPGGGGGGGLIFYSNGAAAITKNLGGGAAGTDGSSTVGAVYGQVGKALTFTISSLPSYLQGGGTICYPALSTTLSEANAGVAGTRMPGASVTYTLTISNKAGGGGAAGVLAELSLPVGIRYQDQSVTVTYTGGTGGDPAISVTTNQGSSIRPRFGKFVVAPGGSVILTVLAKVDCTASTGTYSNTSAQVYYYDPTRSSTTVIQRISPSPSFYSFPTLLNESISTSYTSGGGAVPGSNYNGLSSTAEDVEVTDGIPVLSSSLSPSAIQSGSIFSYTPTSSFALTGVLTFAWSRAAKFGINSNGSSTGTYTVNEVLINTMTSTINVPYVYTLLVNGCVKSSQTVTVAVNPSVLTIIGASPNPVNGGNTSTITVSLPSGVLAASTITLSLTRTISGTAVAGTHYDGLSIPTSVTIPMGQNSISFTLITLPTNVIGQNATLGFSSTLANYTINGATVTIVGATVNSVITTSSGVVTEGLSRTLRASLPSGFTTDGPLTLTIGSSPAFSLSYTIIPTVVFIPAGGNSVSFTVQTVSDGNVGDNSFSIAANANGFSAISGTLGVTDVDGGGAITLTISSGVITETLSTTLTISLPVGVNTNTALSITLGHSTFPGGYSISPSAVIQAGQHSATIVVETADDGNIGNQVFSITGTASVPNFVVMAGTLTVTDTSAMTLTISPGTITETLSKIFTVSLPSGVKTNTALIVGLGHSPFPSGYSISSSVVIQVGQNSATFSIKTARDNNVGNNTFSITGTVSATNFTIIPGVLTVEDVDVRGGVGGNGSTNISISSTIVSESLSTTLTVSLPSGVNTNTALTVTLGHGLFPAVGYGISSSVVIQAGQNSATFIAQTARDGNVGDNALSITGTVNPVGTIRPTDFTVIGGILTVVDVDVRGGITGTGSTSLTISSGMVSETQLANLMVSLPAGVNTNTALTITLGHDVFPNLNYTIPLSVVIQPGQNSAAIAVQTYSDGNVGDNVLGISGTVSIPYFTMLSGVLRVEDVDVRGGVGGEGVTTLTISSAIVSEGLSSTLSVRLPDGVNTNTALTVTLGHSAFPLGSYNMPTSVVIQPGANFATFVVGTVSDGNVGDNVLSITGTVSSNVVDYVVSGGSLTVTDTNSATLTISSGVVTETLSTTLRVSLSSGKTNTPLTVILGHSAFPNLSYDIPSSVIIQSGESSATIDIQTASDGNVGNNVFSITGTVGGATNLRYIPGMLTVEDVDVRGGIGGSGSTTLTISSGTISETLPIVLRVSLPTDVKTNTPLTVTLGYSAFPVGYTMPSSIVIQSGQNSATFVVQTAGDGNIGDNVLSITGSVSASDFILISGTLTVTNTGSTTLMISSGTLTETLSRTLRVSLPSGVVANTPLTVLLGHSVFPPGYVIPSSVAIQSGQNSATFVIQSASDGNVGNNTFSITGTVSGTNSVVSPGTLQVIDVDVRGGFGGTGTTTLTISSRVLSEGSSVTLNVSLPGTVKTNEPLGFTIQSNTAFLGGYTVNGGSVGGNTNFGLLIPAGEHSVSYTLRTASDGSIRDNIFTLHGLPLVDYTFAIGTLTITNSDARQTPVLSITSANFIPIGGSLTASVSSTATLSSGGSVSYSIIASGSGSATIDPLTYVISGLRGGTVLLTASTTGDTNYSVVSATQTITIGKGRPTLLVGASTTTIRVGDILSISSTSISIAGSPASTGGITYRIVNTVGVGGATIDGLSGVLKAEAAGLVVVEAIQGSDSNYYSPVPATLTITINKGSQTLTISSIDMMGLDGSIMPVVTSTATGGRGGSISYVITDGSGSAIVSPSGLVTATGAGTFTLMAITAGDADYEGSSMSQTISIVSLSVSTSGQSLGEGTSGMITISLNPANISLSRDIVFTFGGSVVSSGRFSVPTSVTLTSGQPAVAFSVSGLSDKVLYNDADLVLNANSVYLGSLSTALSIVDVTALNPDNRVLTIGNGTIYNSDMISMTVSLPVGITTARAIQVMLSIGSGSELSLLASSPKVSGSAIILVDGHSGSFSVEATSLNKQPAVVVIEGSSASMTRVKEGVVTVVNQKIDFAVVVSNNGDGIDDCMGISGIENYPNNTVKIVDRRGRLVYEKTNFLSADCFAGYKAGSLTEKLLDGMYYYIITIYDGGTKDIFKGPLKIKH